MDSKSIGGAALTAPQPTFDFSNFSWKQLRQFGVINSRLAKAMQAGDEAALETEAQTMNEFFARCCTFIPRDWMVTSAPEDINWQDPATYDLVKATYAIPLQKALQEALTADSITKN